MRQSWARGLEDLRDEYAGLLAPAIVEQCWRESLEELTSQARFTSFVPLLAQRRTRQRLRSIAQRQSEHTPS
jgi:Protein of unknown function (DUF3562)